VERVGRADRDCFYAGIGQRIFIARIGLGDVQLLRAGAKVFRVVIDQTLDHNSATELVDSTHLACPCPSNANNSQTEYVHSIPSLPIKN
jgi:hypothetical protein